MNLQSLKTKDQSERKRTKDVSITTVQRRMDMLEWKTTTKDTEVTKGRHLHKSQDQRTSPRTMTTNHKSIHLSSRRQALQLSKTKDKDKDVKQPK